MLQSNYHIRSRSRPEDLCLLTQLQTRNPRVLRALTSLSSSTFTWMTFFFFILSGASLTMSSSFSSSRISMTSSTWSFCISWGIFGVCGTCGLVTCICLCWDCWVLECWDCWESQYCDCLYWYCLSGISDRFLFGVTFVRHFFADELGLDRDSICFLSVSGVFLKMPLKKDNSYSNWWNNEVPFRRPK